MNHREKRQALAGTLALAALVGVALCPFFANKRLDDCHKNLLSYTGVEYTLCLHNLTAQPVVDLFSEAMFTKQRNDAIMERLVYGLVSSAKGKKALIEDNQAILDFGANLGWFSIFAAACGAPRVLAFEPLPVNVEKLYESITKNELKGKVHLFPEVASDSIETFFSYFNAADYTDMIFSKDDNFTELPSNFEPGGLILALKVQDLIPVQPVWILKVSHNGYEDRALAGIEKIVSSKKIQHIIIGAKESPPAREGRKNSLQILLDLSNLGYSLYRIKRDGDFADDKIDSATSLSQLLEALPGHAHAADLAQGLAKMGSIDVFATLEPDVESLWLGGKFERKTELL